MAISIADLKMVKADKPPRILIYGPPGIGKTTLASEFPEPIFLQTEEGTPNGVELPSFGLLNTFGQVMEAVETLYNEPHDRKTVVLDSATELQRLVFAETCARGDDKGNRKNNIEDFGYGKGYVYAGRVMQDVIEGLNALRRDRNMTIVLLAHSRIERFDDPETVSYDRYEIDLHDKLAGAIERDMDAILLLKSPVTVKTEEQGFNRERARGDGGNTAFIHTRGRPAFIAKNRYGMPPQILYLQGSGFTELAKHIPALPAEPTQQAA